MREAEGQSTTPAKLRAQQKKPEAYVFALPEEHRFDYVNRTLRALHLMSYPFRVLPGATQETPRPKGMRLSLRPHQQGAQTLDAMLDLGLGESTGIHTGTPTRD